MDYVGNEDMELQSSLHFAVGQICLSVEREIETAQDDEMESFPSRTDNYLTAEVSSPQNKHSSIPNTYARMSTDAITTLTELTYHYVTTSLSNDLVSFSQHAHRRTIQVDDVKLIARKDSKLLDALNAFEERHLCGGGNISVITKNIKTPKIPQKNSITSFLKERSKKSLIEIDLEESSSSSSTSSSSSLSNTKAKLKSHTNSHLAKKRTHHVPTTKSKRKWKKDLVDTSTSASSSSEEEIDNIEKNRKKFEIICSSSSSGTSSSDSNCSVESFNVNKNKEVADSDVDEVEIIDD